MLGCGKVRFVGSAGSLLGVDGSVWASSVATGPKIEAVAYGLRGEYPDYPFNVPQKYLDGASQ